MLFGNVTCFSVNKENKFANDTNLCNYFSYSHLHIITTFYFLTVFSKDCCSFTFIIL